MESRKETASAKKASGAYNCTQAVCCTYHDFTGLKGAGTGKMLRECQRCVADASEFLEDLLTQETK